MRTDNVKGGRTLSFHLRHNFITQPTLGRQLMQNGHVEIGVGPEWGHSRQGQGEVEVVVGQDGGPQGLEVGMRGRTGQQYPQLALHDFDEGRAAVVQHRKLAGLGRDAYLVAPFAGGGSGYLEGGPHPAAAGGQDHAAGIEYFISFTQLHSGRAACVAFKTQLGLNGKLIATESHAVVGEIGQAQVALGHGVAHGHTVNREVKLGVNGAAALVHETVAEEHHAGQVAAVVSLARASQQLVEVGGSCAEGERIDSGRPAGRGREGAGFDGEAFAAQGFG